MFAGVYYAAKAVQKLKLKDYETFKNEIEILRKLVCLAPSFLCCQDHPNIIKLHEIWEWDKVCFLVLE